MAMAECRSWKAVGPRKVSAVVGVYARRKVREPITAPCVPHSGLEVSNISGMPTHSMLRTTFKKVEEIKQKKFTA